MRTSLLVLAALFVGLSTQASVKSRIQLKGTFTMPAACDDIETQFQAFLTARGKNVKDLATYNRKLANYRKKNSKIAEHNKNAIKFGWTQEVN